MEAMIFAAGLGTRLGAITESMPKALVKVSGVPVLERVARRLIGAGADHLIINVHHFSDQIVDFVRSRDDFGVDVEFSVEQGQPLETGGGLSFAADRFRSGDPFFLHNADILSDIPLESLYQQHATSGALATLATMHRESSRRLLFDQRGLFGRVDDGKKLRLTVRDVVGKVDERAFAGIHIVSPDFLELVNEQGVFSILEPYLRLAGEGKTIASFDAGGYQWIDVGKPADLTAAQRMTDGE